MLLSIRYLPLSGPTTHIATFIGNDMKLGNAKHIPERNYDDVLDAWEALFKTKKLNGIDIASAELYKGGKWSGKHMLSAAPLILEKVNSWDRSKPANTDIKIVLGEFYNDLAMAQKQAPEIVDDLNFGESYLVELRPNPLKDAIENNEVVEATGVSGHEAGHPKKKAKKAKKEESVGA